MEAIPRQTVSSESSPERPATPNCRKRPAMPKESLGVTCGSHSAQGVTRPGESRGVTRSHHGSLGPSQTDEPNLFWSHSEFRRRKDGCRYTRLALPLYETCFAKSGPWSPATVSMAAGILRHRARLSHLLRLQFPPAEVSTLLGVTLPSPVCRCTVFCPRVIGVSCCNAGALAEFVGNKFSATSGLATSKSDLSGTVETRDGWLKFNSLFAR